MTLSPDFTKSLHTREMLKKFESYLEKNKSLFQSVRVSSVHFESSSDWLSAFRGTDGVEFDPNSKHLIVRTFHQDTEIQLSQLEKENSDSSSRVGSFLVDADSAKVLNTYNIRIDSRDTL